MCLMPTFLGQYEQTHDWATSRRFVEEEGRKNNDCLFLCQGILDFVGAGNPGNF